MSMTPSLRRRVIALREAVNRSGPSPEVLGVVLRPSDDREARIAAAVATGARFIYVANTGRNH